MDYDDQAILLMHNIARERVLEGEEYEKYSNAMYPLEEFDKALWEGEPYYLSRVNGALEESMGNEVQQKATAVFGSAGGAAMLVEVIDRRSGRSAGIMRF